MHRISSRILLMTGSSLLFKTICFHLRSNHRVFHYIDLRSASSLHELIGTVISSRAESSKLIPIFPEPSLHLRAAFMFYFNCFQYVLTVLLGLLCLGIKYGENSILCLILKHTSNLYISRIAPKLQTWPNHSAVHRDCHLLWLGATSIHVPNLRG